MLIATLIAAKSLPVDALDQAKSLLAAKGGKTGAIKWLESQKAVDVPLENISLTDARSALFDFTTDVDVFVQEEAHRRKKLLISDMDSTAIQDECMDELADYAGFRKESEDITIRAMRGELNFEESLKARTKLLTGLKTSVIQECYRDRIHQTPGIKTLIQTMNANGAHCFLVSGGFLDFAIPVAKEIGFEKAFANTLEVEGDTLTGRVLDPILGPETKKEILLEECARYNISIEDSITLGDGANDIPMIQAAGLGVAYHAKPRTVSMSDAHISYGDMTTILYAQGYTSDQWVK
ncbi:MAG: phosphoserine phosphatase SerB [Zymomonas mobilis subsp. pomaceae]|uniref:Phosphoserine phosphatase n=1 Tax=Zymomonas mobilis subsp. pomaceae (strain ATCC 29192 / DSM 22645 / JCM 10191 / CCUG 17912 / NBRC 13757 / NCIMB 11200 / NRRL B-4491 / Barker I) TaxID=579138 RepID=F8ETQ3_ZYMMT|nr:phosphoserine phosphatase SerB [Zymomonas mobilis]AEI37063.1 phosphoserine phosphatase SerB [Zymomonas mobilis subsp. pomaceae ATCC 29192]MDX5948434.1 phosphoserine phosphatase SerB [Zymomonas mobilis subsp. pomaceae]GEB89502.1 phosphoserine phosphatase SerB [Zymomonas mobilis subsp. pomaceae]